MQRTELEGLTANGRWWMVQDDDRKATLDEINEALRRSLAEGEMADRVWAGWARTESGGKR